jgi:hypothetical protein
MSADAEIGPPTVRLRRDLLEIGVFHLQRHGPAADPVRLAIAPDLGNEWYKLRPRGVELEDIGGEGVLGADRLARAVGLDGPLVDRPRDPIIPGAGFPEMLLEEGERLCLEVGPLSMPRRCILAAVAGPTPRNFLTGSASTKAGPWCGVITNWPFGLF